MTTLNMIYKLRMKEMQHFKRKLVNQLKILNSSSNKVYSKKKSFIMQTNNNRNVMNNYYNMKVSFNR